RRSRIGSVALAVVVALVVFVAGAQAAGTTQTLNISLKGTSTPKTIINTPVFACDVCWPDGSGTTDYLGVQGSVDMTVGWDAPSTIDVNWLPGDVRQGSKLNVGDTLTNNPGDLKVTYTATVVAGHFSDDGSGLKPVPGDTISPSVSVDDTASCAI